MSSISHQPHRRSVLKGAAWAAPAVVVATAAPALAASPAASLAFSGVTAVRVPVTNTLSVTSVLTNSGGASTVALTIVVTLTPTNGNFGGSIAANAVTGYNVTGPVSVNPRGQRFTYQATTQLSNTTGNNSRNFNPSFTNVDSATVVALLATTTGGTSGSGSATSAL